jgi:hypothetical protein
MVQFGARREPAPKARRQKRAAALSRKGARHIQEIDRLFFRLGDSAQIRRNLEADASMGQASTDIIQPKHTFPRIALAATTSG